MKHNALNRFNHVVAIGGGHGLGRVLSSLSFLGDRLTGIVATTDNGGSTGRLRADQDCIAWGDLRNCLSELAERPSMGTLLFEYRFSGKMELAGHNLGNLILLALDELCVRPLEAVNLIRRLLKIETKVIPMSEQPTHLVAIEASGNRVLGELNVDNMTDTPIALSLEPQVSVTKEACEAVKHAELIILGPGSFLTSIMPPLLLPQFAETLAQSKAEIILIDNLTKEPSPISHCNIEDKLDWCHQLLGVEIVNKILCHGDHPLQKENTYFYPLRSKHHIGLHDRLALADALSNMVSSNNVRAQAS
ncbi:uridine diphosphate-N-acetylglucosamine-binding protein YvcK [uncultured Shewanella sp.]|uniref:uridine diphosphate-N-acetylglucosamine-binding protein YvcK n=1 Tax=uncultured Shewanella sp. TaxID=173975 RepID=UPI00260C158C|nr:uridine diphosphate-N-acetylglucosamine-binding protein YvcK [uncultured Shewanella sp.]